MEESVKIVNVGVVSVREKSPRLVRRRTLVRAMLEDLRIKSKLLIIIIIIIYIDY